MTGSREATAGTIGLHRVDGGRVASSGVRTRGVLRVVGAACALIVMTSCDADSAPGEDTATTSTSSPRAAETPPKSVLPKETVLTCADAVRSRRGSRPPGVRAGDITFSGWEAGPAGSPGVPRAADVRVSVPPALQDWLFRKGPLLVRAGAGPVDLTLMGDGQAGLWVPDKQWTSMTPPDASQWASKRISIRGCPHEDVFFFGGLLGESETTCVAIRVESGARTWNVSRQLGGGAC
jgi:hypothetical protein